MPVFPLVRKNLLRRSCYLGGNLCSKGGQFCRPVCATVSDFLLSRNRCQLSTWLATYRNDDSFALIGFGHQFIQFLSGFFDRCRHVWIIHKIQAPPSSSSVSGRIAVWTESTNELERQVSPWCRDAIHRRPLPYRRTGWHPVTQSWAANPAYHRRARPKCRSLSLPSSLPLSHLPATKKTRVKMKVKTRNEWSRPLAFVGRDGIPSGRAGRQPSARWDAGHSSGTDRTIDRG